MEYYEIEMKGKFWLENLVSTPAYVAGDEGRVIYQSTDKELYFADDTSWRTVGIPSGTRMLFYQNTAPTGWTIFTSVDDTLVYFTKGSAAGGNAGGAVKSGSTWNQPVHAHSVTPSSHSHTVPPLAYSGLSHTHTVATHAHTGPSHTHTGPSHTHTGPSHTHTGPSHTHSMANHVHTTGEKWLSYTEIPQHKHLLSTMGSDGQSFAATPYQLSSAMTGWVGEAVVSELPHNHGNTGAPSPGSTEASGTAATGASGTAATGASGTDLTGASGTGSTSGSGTLTTSDAAAGESGTTGGGSTGSTSSGTVTSADSATENSWRPSGHCVIICTKN